MTDTHDPPRWLDGSSELPDDLREGLSDYAASGPSAAQRARMLTALEPALGASLATPLTKGGFALWKSKVVGLAVLALATTSTWFVLEGDESMVRPPVPHAATPSGSALPPAEHSPVEAMEHPEAMDVSAPEVAPAAPAKRRAVRAVKPIAVVEPEAELQAASNPAAELALLSRARRVLIAAPARALELTAEHARTYPQGAFSEEREIIAVEALIKAGRREEATQRADEFARVHPRSAHLARLGVILDAR